MTTTVGRWLEERTTDVPRDLSRWLARYAEDDGGRPAGVLEERGRRALSEAMGRPGRDRRAAAALLAADAYLTFACEALLELDEPEPAFHALVVGVAAEPG